MDLPLLQTAVVACPVLGVERESHEIVGIPTEHFDEVVDFVRIVCANSIKPPLKGVLLDKLWLPSSKGEELAVVKIYVPRSIFVHHSPGGPMHRMVDSNLPMPQAYLARLFQQRSHTKIIHFDEQLVPSATLEDLSPDLWKQFLTPRSDADEILLRKLCLVHPNEDRTMRPTVASVLMASEDPRRWLPNAYIQAVAYRGDAIRTHTAEGLPA